MGLVWVILQSGRMKNNQLPIALVARDIFYLKIDIRIYVQYLCVLGGCFRH